MIVGIEWLIEAAGCDPVALRDQNALEAVLSRVIADLGLKSVGAIWHKFEREGGVTGLIALTESHLACHTYPEYKTATFNLYCCRTRPEWDWEAHLKTRLAAEAVSVTRIERGGNQSQISDLKFEIGFSTSQSENSNPKCDTEMSRPESEISNLKFEIAGGRK